MKGVILAGGDGTRLHPLTKVTNKHLLPVYNKPMIYYPLNTLLTAGITEIMIVSGRGHAGHFLELLGSGADFGCKFTYEIQEKSGGIAQALGLAEDWVDGDDTAVILGDNIFEDSVKNDVTVFNGGAKIFLKRVPDANRFGVAVMVNDWICDIVEKPERHISDLAVTGLYFYDDAVFDFIHDLTPSARGELEITDVNNRYLGNGELDFTILPGFWSDAGTFDSLISAGAMIREHEVTVKRNEMVNGLL